MNQNLKPKKIEIKTLNYETKDFASKFLILDTQTSNKNDVQLFRLLILEFQFPIHTYANPTHKKSKLCKAKRTY